MAKKEQEPEPEPERRKTRGAWAWLSGAFAAFAIVATSLGFVVVGPLTVEAQPGEILPTVAPTESPIPAPAVTASPADIATLTATDVFDSPDITVVAPPPPKASSTRRTPSVNGPAYLGYTPAQYCALIRSGEISSFSTSGSDPYTFLTTANKERYEIGASPLTWTSSLATSSTDWSATMANTGVFAHSPNAGVLYGENIAANQGYDYPLATAQWGWMHSTTGHCENLMNRDYRTFGAGMAVTPEGRYYFTEQFGF